MTRLLFIGLVFFVTCSAVVCGELTCGVNERKDDCPVDCLSDYCPRNEAEANKPQSCFQPKVCPPPKCKCIFNYRRSRNGKCIPTTSCPPFKCKGVNEEFNPCPLLCPTDDCSQASPTGKCPKLGRIGIVLTCNPRCRCKKGYWRKNGKCVPYAQCPTANLTPGEGKPKIPSLNCGPNEEKICSTGCPPAKTCENRNIGYACPAVVLPCKPVCECKVGYYRNGIGQCITEAECAKCSKPNEFYTCGSACDNVCKTIKTQGRTRCPIKNKTCNNQCYCKDGYARDAKGNCIPIDQCNKPNQKKCHANEEYVLCKSCPPDTCIALVAKFKCDSNEPAKYRCRCKPGYFRLKSGSPCVPMCKCPQMANSPDCL